MYCSSTDCTVQCTALTVPSVRPVPLEVVATQQTNFRDFYIYIHMTQFSKNLRIFPFKLVTCTIILSYGSVAAQAEFDLYRKENLLTLSL